LAKPARESDGIAEAIDFSDTGGLAMGVLSREKLCCALFLAISSAGGVAAAQEICRVASPTASFSIPHRDDSPMLNTDPDSGIWKAAASAWMTRDCTRTIDYPKLKSEVRAFWTDEYLYLLFVCPYETLNIFSPPQNDRPRPGLWDRDVVEVFLGADWDNIGIYREFEIAPTGDWIDLDIKLDLKTQRSDGDKHWRSGWRTSARIDKKAGIWYASAQIPLKAVTTQTVAPGTRWRANLYRIAGQGPDSQRQFLCWQPTCAPGRDPNHVPENFGTLVFEGTIPKE
jgi:hypothetical protein